MIPDWMKETGKRSLKGQEVVDDWWEMVTTEEKTEAARR